MDDEAQAESVVLLVAGTIFLAAVASLLVSVPRASQSDEAGPAARQVEADGLADVLVESPGIGWEQGPDLVRRLGLAAPNGTGLDPARIEALKGAGLEAAANGKVDYAEAQRSLGIGGASADFHLSIHPLGVASLLANASLGHLRVGYVADWQDLPGVHLPRGTPDGQLAALANLRLNETSAPGTAAERQALASIGVSFTDRVHVARGSPVATVDRPPATPILDVLGVPFLDGDVYPDRKQHLDAVLPARLPLYDVLVIGSGVDHSTLTANAVKEGIRDWVVAGGHLIVLGSGLQGYQWLQPMFSAGVVTANSLVIDADPNHPLLTQPNALAWESYASHGRGWDLDDAEGSFNHVVVQDGLDVLAISRDGAFGAGRVVMTTYLPREVAAALGPDEAAGFFQNIALFAERTHLHLEYGPPLDRFDAVAVRQATLPDPLLGPVPVRVQVAWG